MNEFNSIVKFLSLHKKEIEREKKNEKERDGLLWVNFKKCLIDV